MADGVRLRRPSEDDAVTAASVRQSPFKSTDYDQVVKTKKMPWRESIAIEKSASPYWMIHGKQYDLRPFVKRHPGGERAIGLGQGIDCTVLYESYHPFTEKHKATLQKYIVGDQIANENTSDVVMSDDTFDWEHTPFYDECKSVARKFFAPRGDETTAEIIQNTKAPPSAWAIHLAGIVVVALAFARWLQGDPLMILVFPFVYWIVCSDLMHNGSHFSISTIPWVNTAATYLGSLHVQYWLWAIQHVVGHHVYTNMHGLDPDVHHFAQDKPGAQREHVPGYRSHREHEYLSKYRRFWRFAMFFQVGATTAAIALLNVPMYLAERAVLTTKINERYIVNIKLDRMILLAGCLAFLWAHGIGYGLFMLSWSWIVHGALFNVFSQISHVNESSMDAAEKYRQQKGLAKNEWAVHELLTAVDYGTNSKFWSMMSINLNHQICHHLFPGVHPAHYPALRKQLIPVAARHGIDYAGRSSGTFWQAVSQYLVWISKLNERVSSDVYIGSTWDTSSIWGAATILGLLAISLCLPVVLLFVF